MRLWLSAWALDTGLENFLSHVELSQDISDSDFPECLKMLHSPAHACLQNSHSYFCHLPPSRYLECLACKSYIGPITSPAWDGGDLFLPWLSAHPTQSQAFHGLIQCVESSGILCTVETQTPLLRMGEQGWGTLSFSSSQRLKSNLTRVLLVTCLLNGDLNTTNFN